MSGLDVSIRPATVDDAPMIAAVHVRSWQVAYRGQLPDELLDGLSVERRTQRWGVRWWAERGASHHLLVAEAGGALVGFAAIGPSRDDDATIGVGELFAIYAAPETWGQGVGRALMNAAIDAGRSAGFGEATLWVLETNERARRFYAAAGWHADGGRRVEQIGDTDPIVVRYRRDL